MYNAPNNEMPSFDVSIQNEQQHFEIRDEISTFDTSHADYADTMILTDLYKCDL